MRNLTLRTIGAAVATAAAVCFLSGFVSDKISDDAKAFEVELVAMKGQEPPKILDKLESWKFELIDAWMADGAASPDFKAHNKGKTKFTKKEMADLFGAPGKYKLALYGLQVATGSATMGTVDELGMSYQKDATVNLQVLTVVRIVFRDEKLVDVRVWPKLQSSSVAGGTWYYRHRP